MDNLILSALLVISVLGLAVAYLNLSKRLGKVSRKLPYRVANEGDVEVLKTEIHNIYEALRSDIKRAAKVVLKVDYPNYTGYKVCNDKVEHPWTYSRSGLSVAFVKVVKGQIVESEIKTPIEVIERARDIEYINAISSKTGSE